MLQVKDSYEVVLRELDTVAEHLAGLAERHRETVMAGRTHGQHAIPVTFGFKAATWLDEVRAPETTAHPSRPPDSGRRARRGGGDLCLVG